MSKGTTTTTARDGAFSTRAHDVLPARTAETMCLAIALSSPSGRMSNRSRAAAQAKLGEMLFGGYQPSKLPLQPSKADRLRQEAAQCRDLAARGMRPRAFIKQAEWCEAQAALAEGADVRVTDAEQQHGTASNEPT